MRFFLIIAVFLAAFAADAGYVEIGTGGTAATNRPFCGS